MGSWLSTVWSLLPAEKTPLCTRNQNFHDSSYSCWHLNFQSLGSGQSVNSILYGGIIISLTIRSGKDRIFISFFVQEIFTILCQKWAKLNHLSENLYLKRFWEEEKGLMPPQFLKHQKSRVGIALIKGDCSYWVFFVDRFVSLRKSAWGSVLRIKKSKPEKLDFAVYVDCTAPTTGKLKLFGKPFFLLFFLSC